MENENNSLKTSLKKTQFFDWHHAAGARMLPFAGYEMPIQYEGVIPEHKTVRNACGLFDVSHMGVARVLGERATTFLDSCFTRDLSKLSNGKASYGFLCRPNGGCVDDLIVYKVSAQEYWLVLNASNKEKDLAYLGSQPQSNSVRLEGLFEEISLVALQGPRAYELLEKCGVAKSLMTPFAFVDAEVLGEKMKIAFTGYTGEKGCEIFLPSDGALEFWKKILAMGESVGLRPIGLAARDTLRTEMGYSLYGHELAEDISPIEAGLAWAVSFKKTADYLGKEALKKQSENPPRKLVCLKSSGRQAPRSGMKICDSQGAERGFVTSGTFAPSLDYAIGMALVDAQSTAPYFVKMREDKLVPFEVTDRPFYKPI
jgi:aminomethyltransferase